MKVSKRTASKILKRAEVGCAICGWKEAACDIHHIIPKKLNGKDGHDNLVILCPNHHRLAGEGKLKPIDFSNKTVADTLKNWKDFYAINN